MFDLLYTVKVIQYAAVILKLLPQTFPSLQCYVLFSDHLVLLLCICSPRYLMRPHPLTYLRCCQGNCLALLVSVTNSPH